MLFFLSNYKAQAQDLTDTKSLLKSKVWLMDEGLKVTMRVTDTEIIRYVDGEAVISVKYHLSDKKCGESSFDPNKVGLISKGNYIFYEKGSCSYIKFVNPSEFKMIVATVTGPVLTSFFAKP